MANIVDYIVFMTYDLHGQWDYGNQWAQEGCQAGDCLRSHINMTETMYTLAMITKAGAPTSKIAVAVSSYGRSFKMATAGCSGPDCTYIGPNSTAAMGQCTQTAGYISNAEIFDIIYTNDSDLSPNSWYDSDTDTNYLVYNQTEWVAYMGNEVRDSRRNKWKDLKFAGTVDWAVDLAAFGDSDGDPTGDCPSCNDNQLPNTPWEPCDVGPIANLDDLSDDTVNNWPVHCRGLYTLQALLGLFDEAMGNYTELMNGGYDDKFQIYAKAVTGSAGSQVHDFMMDHGNDYFKCNVMEMTLCCRICHQTWSDNQCQYCFEASYDDCYHYGFGTSNFDTIPDVSEPHNLIDRPQKSAVVKWGNISEPCPPDYSKSGIEGTGRHDKSIYWSLDSAKADAFWADLFSATGIPKDKIEFGRYASKYPGVISYSFIIDFSEHVLLDSSSHHRFMDRPLLTLDVTVVDYCGGRIVSADNECWNNGYGFNEPMPHGFGIEDVANPKSVAQKGLDSVTAADLRSQINRVIINMQALAYPSDGIEIVDAVSLPIMMVVQGVESMSMVVQSAIKLEEAERKALIMAFVGAILFLVPVAGEILGSVAELADIGVIITMTGVAGNVAMDVYTIVDDPKNAPLAIMDLILAPISLADAVLISKAAQIKRGMGAE